MLVQPERFDADEALALRVLVVDSTREPVDGIPVALGPIGAAGSDVPPIVARSGRDGIATLRGFERAVENSSPYGNWCVYFPFPEAHAELVPIDPLLPQSEPIVLEVPELGRLVVEVVDAAGRPVSAKGDLRIFVTPPEGSENAKVAKRLEQLGYGGGGFFGARPIAMPLTAPGELVIDPIALGLELRVQSVLQEYAGAMVAGQGPTRAGETARFRLVLPRFGPVIAGRMVLPDGRPLPPKKLTGLLHDDPTLRVRRGNARLEVVADGRFRFDASKFAVRDRLPPWLELIDFEGEQIRGRARIALPDLLRDEVVDVGDVPFELASLLAEGRVVDEAGSGRSKATVMVFDAMTESVFEANPGSAIAELSSGEDGDFRAFGLVDPSGTSAAVSEVVLVAKTDAAVSLPLRLPPGSKDVTVRLQPTGALEGEVVVDRIDGLHVAMLVRCCDPSFSDFGWPTRIGEGRFRWDHVPAGRVDVGIRLNHEGIIHVVPGIEVVAGKVNVDPRLSPLDLRSLLPKYRVEVVDEDGRPLTHGTVTFHGLTNREPAMVLVNDGLAELPTSSREADLTVRAMGYRTVRRTSALTPARVVLEPAPQVRIAIEPPLTPDEKHPRISLSLTLVAKERSVDEPVPVRVRFDASGGCLVPFVEPGRFSWQLDVSFDKPARGTDPDREVEVIERWEEARAEFGTLKSWIDIAESDLGGTIALRLPRAKREQLAKMARIAAEAGS